MNPIKEYYPDGKLQCIGFMNDNIQVGRWKFYHGNGQIFSEGEFDNSGKPIGIWNEYYENGQIKYEAISVRGNCFNFADDDVKLINFWTEDGLQIVVNGNGRLILYLDNGNIQHVSFWTNGLKEGILQEFYPNGCLHEQHTYLKGLKSGLSKVFHENGSLYSEVNYLNGKHCGKFTYWYENGQIAEEGEESNGNYIILNFWAEDGRRTLVDGLGFIIRKYGATGGDIYEQHYENGKMIYEKKIAGVMYGRFTPYENPEANTQ
jgi:antitoxin component YwqK of YwqJK toxin-antitoxin module